MLISGDHASVDLRILRYESELAAGDRRRVTDWLVMRAVAVDGAETHVYDRVSLDVEEALRVAPWLRVAAGQSPSSEQVHPGAMLQFAEPDVAAQMLNRSEETVVTRWYFYDRDAPVTSLGHVTMNARLVDISCSREHLQFCADAWTTELHSFLVS